MAPPKRVGDPCVSRLPFGHAPILSLGTNFRPAHGKSHVTDQAKPRFLNRPERIAFYGCLIVFAAFAVLTILWDQDVAWNEVAFRIGAALGAGAIGLVYRLLDRKEGIALAMIGTGLFVGFTNSALLLNYLFFPVSKPIIDPALMRADAWLGYCWSCFVVGLADYPWLGRALSWVYHTSLFQMFGLIVILGFMQKHLKMYRFVCIGMLAGLMTVAIWAVFPSFGPSAYQQVPPEAANRIDLVVSNAYGSELLRLAQQGSPVLDASQFLGVIAFPSFHTVMALIAVWSSRGLILFYPVLALNTLMIPAILSHGRTPPGRCRGWDRCFCLGSVGHA